MALETLVNILLIDDDNVDVMTVRRGLASRKVPHALTVAKDGSEGLTALRGSDNRSALARPYIIMLDLNLPTMDGHEFLAELRRDPDHADAVVFVLTTSDADRDRRSAYQHNVAGYLLKSELGPDFAPMADLLACYVASVRLP